MPIPRWIKYREDMIKMDSAIKTLENPAPTAKPIYTWDEIAGKPTTFSSDWDKVANKPNTFAPIIGETATTAKAGNAKTSTLEVQAAIAAKAQILALTPITASAPLDLLGAIAQIATLKAQLNAIINALKA